MNKSKYLIIIASTIVLAAVGLYAYDELIEDKESKIQETRSEITIQTEPESIEIVELTGTPLDNYSPEERDQHCGKSDFKSTRYIEEFEIPTPCTQPLSIITDSEDNVWFVQSNTGNVAMFDPITKEFVEYQNDQWNLKTASMMWGITITEDNEIWFTDETNDYIWRFSIDDKTYSK